MPVNANDIFKCDLHDFSTSNISEWDQHCLKEEHEYDLHTPCANGCGAIIHIKPKQKLGVDAKRIPRGYLCEDCKKKVKDAKPVKEAGEEVRGKEN